MSRLLPLAALAALILAPCAYAQTGPGGLSPSMGNCTNGSAEHFEIGLRFEGSANAHTVDIDVVDTRPGGATLSYTVDQNTPTTSGCQWQAYVGEAAPGGAGGGTYSAELLNNVRYLLRFTATDGGQAVYTEEFSYLKCGNAANPYSAGPGPYGSVYCPYGEASAFPDILFYADQNDDRLRVVPLAILPGGDNGPSVDDYLGRDWVLPLNMRNVCEAAGTCTDGVPSLNAQYRDVQFLTRQTAPPYAVDRLDTEAFPLNHEITTTINNSANWAGYQVDHVAADVSSLAFAPGQRLRTDDAGAQITGVALSGDRESFSWRGVSVEDGTLSSGGSYAGEYTGNLALTDVSITQVAVPAGKFGGEGAALEAVGSASTLYDPVVTLTNTVIAGTDNGHGVLASRGADVTIAGSSELRGNELFGAKALSGARVTLDGENSKIERNLAGGLYASGGTGQVERGQILRNDGPGLASRNQGGAIIVQEFTGGGGGGTGSAGKSTAARSIIADNVGGLSAQQSSNTGSVLPACVQAPCDFTAVTRHSILRNADGGTVAQGFFDARAQQGSTVLSEGNFWGLNVTAQADLTVVQDAFSTVSISPDNTPPSVTGARSTTAGKGGDGPEGVFALVADADAASMRGDHETARATTAAALAAAFTLPEETAAYALAGRVMIAGDSPLVETWLSERLDGHARSLALSALAGAYERTGRTSEARAAFEALAETDRAAEAFAGLARVAAADGRETDALSAFRALVGASADAETVTDTGTLLEAAFPDADPGAERTAPDIASGKTGTAPTASALAAVPNPAAESASVRFTLAAAGPVRLAVYDALGREVAVLADGAHEPGVHTAAFDASALAPGVYLVRLTAGDASTVTRLTVAR